MKPWFFLLVLLAVAETPAWAVNNESGVSFGPAFYSGEVANNVVPAYGFQVTYLTSQLFSKEFNWSHRFDLALLMLGKDFGGKGMSYNGVSGTYTSAFRLNFARANIIPFIEAGPALSIYALYTSGGTATESKNQTSLKYGYMVGTGFDNLNGPRGSGGWGISLSYFQMLGSPPVFEFPAGSLAAKGVKIDIRFLFGSKK